MEHLLASWRVVASEIEIIRGDIQRDRKRIDAELDAQGYAEYGPLPGNDSDIAQVIREARQSRDRSVTGAGPSWRGLVPDEDPFWNGPGAFILTNAGRDRSYEVYANGKLLATRHSLVDAKAEIEKRFGQVAWRQVRPEPVRAVHRYFGETDEFSEPRTYYTADLPLVTS